ncbi:MAG: hypothetical protein SF053_10600 [Bacteroidia bacterium]|nr:hypothetical protein [Bacteroidia bacterium]
MVRNIIWGSAALILLLAACKSRVPELMVSQEERLVYRVMETPQATGGDPDRGFYYLTHSGYIGGALPAELYQKLLDTYTDTVLRREGPAGHLPYPMIYYQGAGGVNMVSGSCFTCHASALNGRIVFGLGNSFSDFRPNNAGQTRLLALASRMKFDKDSPERAAADHALGYFRAITPRIMTDNPNVNPAFRLEEACAAQRNPADLTYRRQPVFMMNTFNIGSDTPPLWNVAKKQALYYNGMGRGDFTKLLMQASVLGIADSTAAREVQQSFDDVLAWLRSITPPAWPEAVDPSLAAAGEVIFLDKCSKCHGRYGAEETYPNKMVPLAEIKTDSLYALYFLRAGLDDWYNSSWFATSQPRSEMRPSAAYIAPPLDGIWASAPYLHNGSVPTLAALLDSRIRPDYWSRSGDSRDYDYAAVGWRYTTESNGRGKNTYNATLPGYENIGHYFADTLSDTQRTALLEYLKTL